MEAEITKGSVFIMVIFGLFAGGSLNKNKCPFCGKDLEYGSIRQEQGELISAAHEVNVLRLNSFGELEAGTRKYKEARKPGTTYWTLKCPKHNYTIERIETKREKWVKTIGDSERDLYEVTRWDYRFVSAGDLSEGNVKKLKRCCQNASKDLYKTPKL